jgi:hypothetical protein
MRLAGFWTLTCTSGSGGCGASIAVVVPAALREGLGLRLGVGGRDDRVTAGSVLCQGDCGRRRQRGFAFDVYGGPKLGFGKRGSTTRSITLGLTARCGGKQTRKEITVVFAEDGSVDYDRSDFNGNDIPDGREQN